MSLPFLNPKKIVSVVTAKTKPEGGIEDTGREDEMDPGILSAAEDLIRAIHAKDSHAVVEALEAAFQMLDQDYPEEVGSDE